MDNGLCQLLADAAQLECAAMHNLITRDNRHVLDIYIYDTYLYDSTCLLVN